MGPLFDNLGSQWHVATVKTGSLTDWKPLYLARRVQWEKGSQCRDHPDFHPQTLGLFSLKHQFFLPCGKAARCMYKTQKTV